MRPGLTPDDFNVSRMSDKNYNLFFFPASLYNILLIGSELS